MLRIGAVFAVLNILVLNLYAQKDTIWFDKSWKETSKDKAAFFRTEHIKKGDKFLFIDYYKSGVKQMEGLSLDKNIPIFDGVVTWYYENGKTHQIVEYRKGIENGKWTVYYKNGKLLSEEHYKKGKLEGAHKSYYNDGKLKESGSYENDLRSGYWKFYYANGKLKEEGTYKNGKKVNTWKVYYYDGENQDQKYY